MDRTTRQAGWTLWETIIGLNIIAIALVGFTGVFSSTEVLVREGRAKHRAEELLRRNLEALANVLRHADDDTLTGFDANGLASNPSFAEVTGVDERGPIYGPLQELRWVASSEAVPDVSSPGRVMLVSSGASRLIADRVPGGAFKVRWDGGALVVEVSTYHVVDGHTEVVRGSTAIAVRN